MKRQCNQRQALWSDHIDKWERSGQSRASYCRENNLKAHQFSYWYGKIRPGGVNIRKMPPRSQSAPAFVPIEVSLASQEAGLTICLPNGVRIEGITASSLAMAPQLIEVLK